MRAMPEQVLTNGQQNGHREMSQQSSALKIVKGNVKEKCVKFENYSSIESLLVGVVLADERTIDRRQSIYSDGKNVILGALLIENVNVNVEELRRLMCTELPSLPASFIFLTKEGWPVLKSQERIIDASHLISDKNTITIKKQFEKPRIGVSTTTGECLGFVFVELNWTARQVREAMESQLQNLNVPSKIFKFIERNGWPVLLSQETVLTLIDILLGPNVCIQYEEKLTTSHSEVSRPSALPVRRFTFSPADCSRPSQDCTDSAGVIKRKKSSKLSRLESLRKGKEIEKKQRLLKEEMVAKPILISYVRAEASEHALSLKEELFAMGFSVYLDVHEIKTGTDWQDALNFAVTHCYIFVPLITPMYGKTLWTNREIKLADKLSKLIIPINFIDLWPPECLAIQFVSTQYIPWKLQDCDHNVKVDSEKSSDPRIWSTEYVKRVAKQIAECYRENFRREKWRLSNVPAFPSPIDDHPVMRSLEFTQNNKQMVVISVHPKQLCLARDMKEMIEKEGYQVWCSIDIQENSDGLLLDEGSPRDLPTIPEGKVFFSTTEDEFTSSSVDNKRCSVRSELDSGAVGEHKHLSRLMSQYTDIIQISSLTPEKVDRLRNFQQNVDKAAVVIAIVSEHYTKSKTSQQQIYYCESRKQVILIKSDISHIPTWFTMLVGNDMIRKISNPQFDFTLKNRIKQSLNPSISQTSKDATFEAQINYLVSFMKSNLPLLDACVYISGSRKLQNHRAQEICKAVGRELAKIKDITVVTGGYSGAADIVARTFYEYRETNPIPGSRDEPSVVHILPMQDSQDFAFKSHQNPNGKFEAPSYGKTLFLGNSIKERETAAARLFDTCILIEGGPGAAREVEEFIWNDHFVIPIISTGGTAGGQFGVPVKIFEIPPGVSENDWSVLSVKDADVEIVSKAVVNIMRSLKTAIASHSNSQVKKLRNKKKLKSRKLKTKDNDSDDNSSRSMIEEELMQSYPRKLNNKGLLKRQKMDIEESTLTLASNKQRKRWWHRLLRFFTHKSR